MKAEQAKKVADQALEQLAEALAAGRSDELTRYLSMLAKFHKYSFGNVMLILSQKPDATHVAGFNTWKQVGRYVRQGEKGIVIIAPMVFRKSENRRGGRDAESAAAEFSERDETVLRFRGVYVFDVSQTDGQPLPEPAGINGDPGQHLDQIKTVVASRGIALDYEIGLGSALGLSRGGRISIRPGQPAGEEFAVIVHELAHELLHRGEDRPASKTVRETEAEAVAFVVAQAVGLDAGAAARDYIQLYDGKTDTLSASLDRIQRTAADIIAALHAPEEQAHAA